MDRSPERRLGKRAEGNDVGNALKSVYDRTLNEAIPPDLLDLLGKLD
ncbi:MAG TPA: NepR family anti-sigma factor [Allosphingosinicella sp.]|nr:NepR family anti-sigma factor [Allosphingosinicella sp.]